MNWDSYRYFLAVADTGSLSAAARQLSVSQPTVGRQIAGLEARIGTRLFNRASHGYSLTPAGTEIFDRIQDISADLMAVERQVEQQDQEISGRVRISATEGFGSYWLAEKLAAFLKLYPHIFFDLILNVEVLDTRRREADITVRITYPQSEDLVGRRAGYVGFGFYAAKSYLSEYGHPRSIADLEQHRFIDWNYQAKGFVLSEALRSQIGSADIVFRTDTVAAQIEAVRQGMGMMAAPHYIASRFGDTEQVLVEETEQMEELWILTHPDLRRTPRIRLVLDYLFEAVRADRLYLEKGLAPSVDISS